MAISAVKLGRLPQRMLMAKSNLAAVFLPAPLVSDWQKNIRAWDSVFGDNFDLDLLTCGNFLYGNCLTIKALSAGGSKVENYKTLCFVCQQSARLYSDLGKQVLLDSFLTKHDHDYASQLVSEASELRELKFEGLEVGRLASFDELLRQKTSPDEFEITPEYELDVRNFMLVYSAMRRYLQSRGPKELGLLNGAYSVNKAAEQAALSLDLRVRYMLGGGSPKKALSTFYLMPEPNYLRTLANGEEWETVAESPLSSNQIRQVHEDLLAKIEGRAHVSYSGNSLKLADLELESELREARISGKKIAFIPLTSPDEFESHDYVFGSEVKWDQTIWISRIIEWASQLSEWVFVFRPHPRMFPNPRDSVTSPLAGQVYEFLKSDSPNVKINDPSDGNSAYRIAQFADIVLGYRSSLPVELMALGKPCLVLDPHNIDSYPAINRDPVYSARDFVQESNKLLAVEEQTFVKHAYRWLFYLNHAKVWRVGSDSNEGEIDSENKILFRFETSKLVGPSAMSLVHFLRKQARRWRLLIAIYNLILVANGSRGDIVPSPPETPLPSSESEEILTLETCTQTLRRKAGWSF